MAERLERWTCSPEDLSYSATRTTRVPSSNPRPRLLKASTEQLTTVGSGFNFRCYPVFNNRDH